MLEGIGRRLWGFPPNLMAPIVAQLGALGSLRWFVANMPRYERTLKRYGALRTHLLCTATSLVGGCPYCSYGHALAFELVYFKRFGAPFSLTEDEIVALHGVGPVEMRNTLASALQPTALRDEVQWLDRLLELESGARDPVGRDDRRLAHLSRMFGVLNTCGIASNTAPDQAHDPINKDVALKRDYALSRARSGDAAGAGTHPTTSTA